MRERQRLVINRQTGGVSMDAELLPDASFEQRIRELKASLPDIGLVETRFLTVSCNAPGCHATAELDFDAPQLPYRWASNDDGEFCPEHKATDKSRDRRPR